MRLEEFVENIRKNQFFYLLDSYTVEFQGVILKSYSERKKSVYIILDKTVFQSKGGGQPTDTGLIHGSDFKVDVKKGMLVDGVCSFG